ncbi:MAG TPA: GNAT family N-acetyltransferase, partial [Gammaproteobacteria bacterium]|nr:GNAT family N-acetyltransferase [Gammaproteobacteria bacterium]
MRMLFDSDFEVVLANTEESKKLHYALRYQVYCQEMQYEDAAQFADQMEKDELDTSSVHFIVRAKRTGEWLAAIRFIVGELETLPTYNLLPAGSFHQQRMAEGVRCSGARVALEISRMCILGSYRKTGASLSSHDGCSNIYGVQRQRQPEVLLGLMRTAYAYCLSKQINICLFTITRSLA